MLNSKLLGSVAELIGIAGMLGIAGRSRSAPSSVGTSAALSRELREAISAWLICVNPD